MVSFKTGFFPVSESGTDLPIIPDEGEVNALDLGLHMRLLFGGFIDMSAEYMRDTSAWSVREDADCAAGGGRSLRTSSRELTASIHRTWSFDCPTPESWVGSCYYDCCNS